MSSKIRYFYRKLRLLIKTYSLRKQLGFPKNAQITLRSLNSQFNIGNNLSIRNYFTLWIEGGKLELGDNVFFNNYCSINCLDFIKIGENTIFGECVKIYDHNHAYDSIDCTIHTHRNKFNFGQVRIGSNCWIGSNVVILKGVTIGDNSIIGAGCVIHRDIEENTIVTLNKTSLEKKRI